MIVKKFDDLDVEDIYVYYLAYKVNNYYEPKVTINEFTKLYSQLIDTFNSKKSKDVDMYDLQRKIWGFDYEAKCRTNMDNFGTSHCDFNFAPYQYNYGLCLNEEDTSKFNTVVYLNVAGLNKRVPFESYNISDNAKKIATSMLYEFWNMYYAYYTKNNKWPIQCNDFDKYVLDYDLASNIGIPSMHDFALEFYKVVSARIQTLINNYGDIEIKYSTIYKKGNPLACTSFDLVMQDFDFGQFLDLMEEKEKKNYRLEYKIYDNEVIYPSSRSKEIGSLVESLDDICYNKDIFKLKVKRR